MCKRLGLLIPLLSLFVAERADAGSPELVSVTRIWDQAQHSAFTDLIRFRDKWFCIFREGKQHGHGDKGKIRIIESGDGNRWVSAALLS